MSMLLVYLTFFYLLVNIFLSKQFCSKSSNDFLLYETAIIKLGKFDANTEGLGIIKRK